MIPKVTRCRKCRQLLTTKKGRLVTVIGEHETCASDGRKHEVERGQSKL